jgi:cytochrome c peroxidase
MKKVSIVFSLLIFVLTAFVSVSQLFVVPKGWPKPIYDFSKNPLSNEKIALGRALFYDPILSKDNTISCACA